MWQYIISFFRPELLLNFRPWPLEGMGLWILFSVFSVIIIAGIGLMVLVRSKQYDWYMKQGLKKFQHAFLTMGIIGFVYAFFAYEGAVFLSARLWLVVWLVVFAVWMYVPMKYCMVEVPRLRKAREEKKNREKYLR